MINVLECKTCGKVKTNQHENCKSCGSVEFLDKTHNFLNKPVKVYQVCDNCDLFEQYGHDCMFYYLNKKSCSKRVVNGEQKPIFK